MFIKRVKRVVDFDTILVKLCSMNDTYGHTMQTLLARHYTIGGTKTVITVLSIPSIKADAMITRLLMK